MKKLLFNILTISIVSLMLFSFSCNNKLSAEEGIVVGEITGKENDITAKASDLEKCFTRFDVYKDSKPSNFGIEYFESTKKYFLNAKGTDSKGNPIIMRVGLTTNSETILMPFSAFGESCTSVNCQECEFHEKGCACEEGGEGNCNHTIAKE